ncbi:hypothetical protein GCM10008171_30580 [Methylopila jiangsuensis]|uniref:Uncharacterized protein n=1 Tax=Methylopila jiangsuensis TaxID=586230 RepID=A0A9W6JKL3_9HYPH|nr:hypothetical protein GCM10008171_30580 [Methylopila jiangsuensis]
MHSASRRPKATSSHVEGANAEKIRSAPNLERLRDAFRGTPRQDLEDGARRRKERRRPLPAAPRASARGAALQPLRLPDGFRLLKGRIVWFRPRVRMTVRPLTALRITGPAFA